MKTAFKFSSWFFRSAFCLSVSACVVGCASNPHPTDPQDPYENYNRAVFKFNMGVDKAVYRPVAKVYSHVVPRPAQKGVTNFFNNVREVPNVANDLLQGNLPYAMNDGWRFIFNSTIGVAGLFDVAKHLGLPRHHQDFGLTLAKWGVRQSPYFLLPFLGPGTVRDQLGSVVDYQALSLWPYIKPRRDRYALYGLDLIQYRAALLPADRLVDQAFDPYIFVRNAYLQKRQQLINKVVAKKPLRHDKNNEADEQHHGEYY